VVACLDRVWGTKKASVDIDYTPDDGRKNTFAGVALGGVTVFLQEGWIDAEPEYEYGVFNVLAQTHGEVTMVRAGASNKALGRPLKASLKGNERRWLARGYKADGPSVCNTWTVPSSKVS
jgi:hypothetical protein